MDQKKRDEIVKIVMRSQRFQETGQISNSHRSHYDERSTYDRYSGSYAQDVEGWSDQDIDDVFDGNPDAYWNID